MKGFYLETEYINLLQLLKAMNIALTGGDAKDMIDAGEVEVNGESETRYRRKLYPGDIVEVMGQKIELKNEKTAE